MVFLNDRELILMTILGTSPMTAKTLRSKAIALSSLIGTDCHSSFTSTWSALSDANMLSLAINYDEPDGDWLLKMSSLGQAAYSDNKNQSSLELDALALAASNLNPENWQIHTSIDCKLLLQIGISIKNSIIIDI